MIPELKAIQHQNGYLFVDEQAQIDKRDLFLSQESIYIFGELDRHGIPADSSKIIAQSPELSIPDIPYVELEENIPQLAASIAMEHRQHGEQWMLGCVYGVVKGYKAAQSKKYSEEDLLSFLDYYNSTALLSATSTGENNGLSKQKILEKYIKSLQPKIDSIELEMEWITDGDEEHDEGGTLSGTVESYQQPVTYQKDGKTFLKVKQINYATG